MHLAAGHAGPTGHAGRSGLTGGHGRSPGRLRLWLTGGIVGGLTALHPVGTILTLLSGTLVWLVAAHLATAVQILLVVRPSLDFTTGTGLPLGPVRINPPAAIGIFLLGVTLFYALDQRLKGRRLERGGIPAAALLLLTGLAALGTVNGYFNLGTPLLAVGLKETLRLASLLALYLLLVNMLKSGLDPDRLLRCLYLGLIAPAVLALFQFLYYLSEGYYSLSPDQVPRGRLTGTFFHATALGLFLALVLTITITLLRNRRLSRIPRTVLVTVLPLCAFLLVFTSARGAWVFLGVSLFIKTLLNPRRMLIPVTVVLILAAAFFGPRIVGRFADVDKGISIQRVVIQHELRNSFEWRIYNWFVLLGVGLRRPILGQGTGSTSQVNPLQSVNKLTEESRGFSAHSEFVGYFVEGGIVGVLALIAYFVLLGRWLLRLYRRLRAAGDPHADLAGVGLEILGGFLVVGLFTMSPLTNTCTYYFVVALLAILRAAELRADSGRAIGPADGPGANPMGATG